MTAMSAHLTSVFAEIKRSEVTRIWAATGGLKPISAIFAARGFQQRNIVDGNATPGFAILYPLQICIQACLGGEPSKTGAKLIKEVAMAQSSTAQSSKTQVQQPQNPHLALGAAVEYLTRAPSFARQPFGVWSRILIGQINRGHYAFARRDGRVVGFVGYGLCSHETARLWLEESRDPTEQECSGGPVILLNGWMVDDDAASHALRTWMHDRCADAEALVAVRFYEDGRMRPVRLPLPSNHAERRGSSA